MKKAIIANNAPAAIGPYSHANVANGFVFTSGQLGFDLNTGKLAEGVEAQAECALAHLKTVLEAAGAGMDTIVKTTVFVQDLKDFAVVNKIYGEKFDGQFPARSCVQVAALPAGGLVEVEAVAVVK